MQNVQNAAEIQQRVINLVELYRTKVGKESEAAHYLANEYQRQYDQEIDLAYDLHEQGIPGYILNIDIPEEDVDKIRVNEQLLGHFYIIVAGDKTDKDILSQFLDGQYDTSIFTEEEESFLRSHFTEMVNYIIMTPNNDLSAIERGEKKDLYLIPAEVLSLINDRFAISSGSKVYNPFTGFAQLACLYKKCSFICEESYLSYYRRWNAYCDRVLETEHIVRSKIDEKQLNAWMKLAIYANGLDAYVVENGSIPTAYDAIVSYIPIIPTSIPGHAYYDNESSDPDIINKIRVSYQNLAEGGKMLLVLPSEYCYEKKVLFSGQAPSYKLELDELWKQLINDNSLVEIVQLPSIMGKNLHDKDGYCIIIAEKGNASKDTTLMDASFASIKSENKQFDQTLDLNLIHSMIENGGIELNTGLRKLVKISRDMVKPDLLVPHVYVIEKPSESEKPVSLASLCSLVTSHIYDVEDDLTEDTPWVDSSNLSPVYPGPLNTETLRKAGLPNNPNGWKYGNKRLSPWSVGAEGSGITDKDVVISEYRNCRYLDGSKDAVLFAFTGKGFCTALIYGTGKPIAVDNDVHVLYPNDGINALNLLAILRLPIVYWQLQTYVSYGLYGPDGLLKDVLIPTDRRVVGDEVIRMKREESVITELVENNLAVLKKHKSKLENYQHVMRKHIRPISSSIRRMERFINCMESSEETKSFLHERLEVIKTHRLYLSEDIERLNEENTYGKAVPFDIDHCLKGFKDYFGSDGYPIVYSNEVAKEALKQYVESHRKELSDMNEADRSKSIELIKEEKSFAYVDIAEYNFGKVVRNILENARIHGFSTNTSRNDYKIEIVLTWNSERKMYQIDFRNNGDPLPDGLSKESYGENRKYAGKTGGTGIGGYEVADTVKHYKGDYAISQDGDWVVVSVYLPKSKSYEERV